MPLQASIRFLTPTSTEVVVYGAKVKAGGLGIGDNCAVGLGHSGSTGSPISAVTAVTAIDDDDPPSPIGGSAAPHGGRPPPVAKGGTMRRIPALLGLGVVFAGPVVSAAGNRGAVTVGGGAFVPFDGRPGPSALLSAEGRIGSNVRLGGEAQYVRFDSDVTTMFLSDEVEDVDHEGVYLRAVARYRWPMGAVAPYAGGGIGFGLLRFEGSSAREDGSRVGVDGGGATFNLLGLGGLEVWPDEPVSLFAEVRLSVDVAGVFADPVGAVSGLAGARIGF